MTVEHHSGRQEPLHCSEWQEAEFFFQLLARLYLCPLLQRQTDTETADSYIIAASSTGKIPWETFPCCHRVVQWIVSCKCACASGNCDSPSFLKVESLGEVALKWGRDHLPPLVCDLFRSNLRFLIQNCFIVSKVLSLWIEMNSAVCTWCLDSDTISVSLYIRSTIVLPSIVLCDSASTLNWPKCRVVVQGIFSFLSCYWPPTPLFSSPCHLFTEMDLGSDLAENK